jgi:spore germination protein YaaH
MIRDMAGRAALKFRVITLLLLCAPALAKPKAIFYYVSTADSWNSLSSHAAQIPIVAPQVFMLDELGVLHGGVEERVQELATQYKIGIMPLLANEKPEAAHVILTDAGRRRGVISEALRRCQQSGCIGLQVDIEGVGLSDGPAFTEFIREAAHAFHARHLELSVALPTPLFQPSAGETYAQMYGGFAVEPQPYDLKAIARAADFITLMTYGQYGVGTRPGPVAGYFWVEQSIRYALQFVPAKKLSLGLGFWAYRWCNSQVTYSGYPEVAALAAQSGALPQWQAWERSPWFEFRQNGCQTTVWYENEHSLTEKLKLVRQYHLHGYSAWRLGQEDPEFWTDTGGDSGKTPAPARFR